jgi:predicted transcriptional regulator
MNSAEWIPGLGPLESAIMTVIWDADQSLNVRMVRERLDYLASDGENPAYTTVMTVMAILCRKGFLARAKGPGSGHGRAWWYQARISREDHLAAVIRRALECAPDPAAVLRRATP